MKHTLIILALFLSGIVSGQVVLVGEQSDKPVVNAGANQSYCDPVTISLTSKVTGDYDSVKWFGGTGTFSDSLAKHTTYTISDADSTAGTITFSLAAYYSFSGVQDTIWDTKVATLLYTPIVYAGIDTTINIGDNIYTGLATSTYGTEYWRTTGVGDFNDYNLVHTTYSVIDQSNFYLILYSENVCGTSDEDSLYVTVTNETNDYESFLERTDQTLDSAYASWYKEAWDSLIYYDNIQDSLDVLLGFRSNTQFNANLNWVNDSFNITNVGATWDADSGYIGNGTSAYLRTNYNPYLHHNNVSNQSVYSAFKIHAGTLTTNASPFGAYQNSARAFQMYITSTPAMRTMIYGSVDIATTSGTLASAVHDWQTWRSNDSVFVNFDATQAVSVRDTGVMTNKEIYLLARNGSAGADRFCDFTMSWWALGGRLSSTQRTKLKEIMTRFGEHWVIPPPNAVPTATDVYISGIEEVGQTLTGNYTYGDDDGDIEGTSTHRWYRATDVSGTGVAVIAGATASTYLTTTADQDKYIAYDVIPVAATGDTPGDSAVSLYFGSIADSATAPEPLAGIKIFEGAFGYGTDSRGAYDTTDSPTILVVDTLSTASLSTSDTSGSFRWCVAQNYPRVIIFSHAGVVDYTGVTGAIRITNPYCNIYGQTAPGNGYTIKGATLEFQTHDILVQHLKIRFGDDSTGADPNARDCITMYNTSDNIVIDHCSFSWGMDEMVSYVNTNGHFALTNCLMGEQLFRSNHYGGTYNTPEKHSLFSIAGSSPDQESYFTMGKNALGFMTGRSPDLYMNNTVIMNSVFRGGKGALDMRNAATDTAKVDLINCYTSVIDHPLLYSSVQDDIASIENTQNAVSRLHVAGNSCARSRAGTITQWDQVALNTRVTQSNTILNDTAGYNSYTSTQVVDSVLKYAGAFYWGRDFIDQRIVDSIRYEGNTMIDSPDTIPAFASVMDNKYTAATDGWLPEGFDWATTNQTLIINGTTYTLNQDCNTPVEIVSYLNTLLPDSIRAYRCNPYIDLNFIGIKTVDKGSDQVLTLNGGTALTTLGWIARTYYGLDLPGWDTTTGTIEHDLPAVPHNDDDSDGYTNLEEWVKTFEE